MTESRTMQHQLSAYNLNLSRFACTLLFGSQAGTKDQLVEDAGIGDRHHSVFCGAILSCPAFWRASVEGEQDEYCSMLELFTHLEREVPSNSRQTPTFGFLPGHEGGDIFLALRSQE